MSRVGKRPVTIPSGVTATVDGQTVKMKGPKGQLQFIVHDDVEVKFENGAVKVAPRFETNRAQALYGTARAQIANLVAGVTKGFEKKLEIVGIGYRSELKGENLALYLGYSHPIVFKLPKSISAKVEKNRLTLVSALPRQPGQARNDRNAGHAEGLQREPVAPAVVDDDVQKPHGARPSRAGQRHPAAAGARAQRQWHGDQSEHGQSRRPPEDFYVPF